MTLMHCPTLSCNDLLKNKLFPKASSRLFSLFLRELQRFPH